jgi:hypothetical protein
VQPSAVGASAAIELVMATEPAALWSGLILWFMVKVVELAL